MSATTFAPRPTQPQLAPPSEARAALAHDDLSPMALFLRELRRDSRYSVLSVADERALTQRVKAGDATARRQMIEHNLRLVVSQARRWRVPGMELMDLVDEGVPGLTRAVEKYDPASGHKFSTYATWWIRQAIGRAVAEKRRAIALPVHAHEAANRALRLAAAFEQDHGRQPTRPELVALVRDSQPASSYARNRARHSAETILAALAANEAVASLDQAVDPWNDEPVPLHAFLADPDDPFAEVEDGAGARELLARLMAAARLTAQQRQVLALRYSLVPHDLPLTVDGLVALEQVGRALGKTRERVRQIEAAALLRLRHAARWADTTEVA